MTEPGANPQDGQSLPDGLEELSKLSGKLDRLFGPRVGGFRRPWARPIDRKPRQIQRSQEVIHLWEMGAKTTLEIKEAIQDRLKSGDTLIEILDSERASHPENPVWWPSLMEVLEWCRFDQGFAQMLDAWTHARQLEILEGITYNVMNPAESGLDPKTLKVQADFAAKVLPRIVNKGMAERVEVDARHTHANQAVEKMSDDALNARLAELSLNPKVRKVLADHLHSEAPAVPAPVEPLRPGAQIIDIDLEIPE